MKGANECLEAVAKVYHLCVIMDTDIEVVWQPLTEDWQQHAVAGISKYEGNSQWELHPWIGELLLAQPDVGGWRPDRNLFTDKHTTRIGTRSFYSRH